MVPFSWAWFGVDPSRPHQSQELDDQPTHESDSAKDGAADGDGPGKFSKKVGTFRCPLRITDNLEGGREDIKPMAIEQNSKVLRYIGAIFGEGIAAEFTDRQLLDRFANRPNERESAELAFTALVERHGPMVLRVCRAVLRDEHDAQDAFQAVFLVLVQKAGSLWVNDSLGPWLHGVALRVSASARGSAIRRRIHERRHAQLELQTVPDQDKENDDLGVVLHEEVGRLPNLYRTAVVLCDLEGLTHEEAARRLGLPVGTVKSRQARGRERLRGRLSRRGLAESAGGVALTLAAERATAAVPSSLVMSTVKWTVLGAKGSTPPGLISTAAVVLAKGALKGMFLHRLRMSAGIISVLSALIATAGLAIHRGAAVMQLRAPRANVIAKGSINAEPPKPFSLDALNAADIPAEKRLADQPENVVAVLGELRGHHAGHVLCLAVSPDGKLLATGADQDNNVRLWDAETLCPLGALVGHRAFVQCVTISLDGHWLASGGGYGDFLLWDLSTSPPKGPTPLLTRGHQGEPNNLIHAAAFTKDSMTLAVAGDSHGVGLFDCSGPQPVERGVLPGLAEEVHSLMFSPDGKTIALAGLQDGSVRLWDMTGNAPRARAVLRPTATVVPNRDGSISVAFSPDGSTLATLAKDGGIRLWDLSKEEPLNRGRLVVRTNEDNVAMIGLGGRAVRLPAANQRRVGGIFIPAIGLKEQAMVAFAPDGKMLAAAQAGGWIRLWNLNGEGEAEVERAAFPAHQGTMDTGVLAFRPDAKTLISCGGDHLIRSWDIEPAEPREKLEPSGPVGGLRAVAFSPDGKTLAVGGDDLLVRLWDLTDARDLSRLPTPKMAVVSNSAWPLAFSPDGRTLVCGNSVLDVSGNEPKMRYVLTINGPAPAAEGIWSLAFAPDGKTLATGGNDHKVRLWDLATDSAKERLALDGNDQWPPVVAISSKGDRLAFSGQNHSIRLWELLGAAPRERAQLKGTGWSISSLVFSPDDKTLVSASNGGTQLWDLSGGTPKTIVPLLSRIGLASYPIKDCMGFSTSFSLDGKRLIAADHVSKGGWLPSKPAVCVYELASGKRLHEWDLSVPCWAIALAPDGRHVAAAQRDGITLILRLPTAPGR
jgi:RNA polymerase sigma factor (sigma-70 family)